MDWTPVNILDIRLDTCFYIDSDFATECKDLRLQKKEFKSKHTLMHSIRAFQERILDLTYVVFIIHHWLSMYHIQSVITSLSAQHRPWH